MAKYGWVLAKTCFEAVLYFGAISIAIILGSEGRLDYLLFPYLFMTILSLFLKSGIEHYLSNKK